MYNIHLKTSLHEEIWRHRINCSARSQDNRYAIFQMTSAVERFLMQMVTNVCAKCEEVKHQKRTILVRVFVNYQDSHLLKLWRGYRALPRI